jgi:hypothetical protein
MITADRIITDIKICSMTLTEVIELIKTETKNHPEEDIFLDGDARAIVGRRHIS